MMISEYILIIAAILDILWQNQLLNHQSTTTSSPPAWPVTRYVGFGVRAVAIVARVFNHTLKQTTLLI